MQNSVRERTGQVAHYIIDNTGSSELGKTKLCKMMWFADLLQYRRCGKTVTGQSEYVRMPKGPVPQDMFPILDELIAGGTVFSQKVMLPNGYVRHELIALEAADHDQFEPAELHAIQKAIATIAPLTAEQASESTHDALWDSLFNGEPMSVAAASIVPGEVTPEEMAFVHANSERFSDEHCAAEGRI